jgi:uncharacterized protein YifE (UPF0438 family)
MRNSTNAIKILNPHYGRREVIVDTDRKEHLSYIGEPFSGLNEILYLLPNEQINLLKNYGAWMEALVRKEIKPLTEAQKRFIEVAHGNRIGRTRFEKAWINSKILEDRNRTDPFVRENQLSARVSNVGSFSNSETIHNGNSNSDGAFGFITGIVLAVLAFSIVPIIPVIIAFFAGHWVNYTFGKK